MPYVAQPHNVEDVDADADAEYETSQASNARPADMDWSVSINSGVWWNIDGD